MLSLTKVSYIHLLHLCVITWTSLVTVCIEISTNVKIDSCHLKLNEIIPFCAFIGR